MNIQELNAYVVVFNGDKVLVLRRKNDLWEFPGGGIEWGEEPEEAAIRETKEETEIVVKEVKLIGVTSATFKKDGNDKHAIYLVYRAEANSDKVKISGEHSEHKWVSIGELKELKLGLNAERALAFIQR